MLGLAVESPHRVESILAQTDEQEREKERDTAVAARFKGADEDAVKESLRGVYRLWKAGRRARGLASVEDSEVFLTIAREVVGEP